MEIQKFDKFIEKIECTFKANKSSINKNENSFEKDELITKLHNRIFSLEQNVEFLMNCLVF